MLFLNRHDAAERLSRALLPWKGRHPLILAIPRGALEIGRVVADRLEGALEVVLVRKLRAPAAPEFAVGAVAENGWSYIAPHAHAAGADDRYLEEEKRFQLNVIQQRRQRYTPHRATTDARGRIAIVVDDGLATGATMSPPCIRCARSNRPRSFARCRWRPPTRLRWCARLPMTWCACSLPRSSARSGSSIASLSRWRMSRRSAG